MTDRLIQVLHPQGSIGDLGNPQVTDHLQCGV